MPHCEQPTLNWLVEIKIHKKCQSNDSQIQIVYPTTLNTFNHSITVSFSFKIKKKIRKIIFVLLFQLLHKTMWYLCICFAMVAKFAILTKKNCNHTFALFTILTLHLKLLYKSGILKYICMRFPKPHSNHTYNNPIYKQLLAVYLHTCYTKWSELFPK